MTAWLANANESAAGRGLLSEPLRQLDRRHPDEIATGHHWGIEADSDQAGPIPASID